MPISKSTFSKWSFLFGLLLFAVAVLFARNAAAQYAVNSFPFYEPFNYVNCPLGGTNSADNNFTSEPSVSRGWDISKSGSVATNEIYVNSACALSYSGLYPSSGSGLQLRPSGVKLNRGLDYAQSGNGGSGTPWCLTNQVFYGGTNIDRIYASFLFTNVVTPTGPANRQICYLRSDTTGGVGLGVVWLSTDGKLMISKNTTATVNAASQTLALTTGTHFIVFRYKVNSANNTDDQVDMWVDPSVTTFGKLDNDYGGPVGIPPTATCTTNSNAKDVNTFRAFYFFTAATNDTALGSGPFTPPTEQWVDELRIGTNWAQVTPPAPPAVANADTFYRAKGTSLKITEASLMANDTAGGFPPVMFGGVSNLVTTAGSALQIFGTTIYYTNDNAVNDAFAYYVTNAALGSVPSTNWVNILQTNSIGQMQSPTIPGGFTYGNTLNVTFAGLVGYTYQMQRNTNLSTGAGWVNIGSADSPLVNGLFTIGDTFSDIGFVPSQAYYRVVLQ